MPSSASVVMEQHWETESHTHLHPEGHAVLCEAGLPRNIANTCLSLFLNKEIPSG